MDFLNYARNMIAGWIAVPELVAPDPQPGDKRRREPENENDRATGRVRIDEEGAAVPVRYGPEVCIADCCRSVALFAD
jgi:hypothetical protein